MTERPLDESEASFKAPVSRRGAENLADSQNNFERGNFMVEASACLVELGETFDNTIENYTKEFSSEDEIVRIKVRRTKAFFSNEGGKEKVMAIYKDLLPKDSHITADRQFLLKAHLKFILERAIDQDLNNPENYVSHGFNHTLNVVGYSHQIITTHPTVVEDLAKEYDISLQQAKFLVENVALFHDFGYPESELRHMPKVSHSMNGAEVINKEYVEIDGKKIPIRDVLVGIFDNKDEVVTDLRNAVLLHNADKNDQDWTASIDTDQGKFLVQEDDILRACERFKVKSISIYFAGTDEGRREAQEKLEHDLEILPENRRPKTKLSDKKYPGRNLKNNFLGLEFFKVSLAEEPLLAIIRLADNMDMTYSRLSSLQKEELFRAYYYAVGDKNNIFYDSNRNIEKGLERIEKEKDEKTKLVLLNGLRDRVAEGITAYQIYYEQKNSDSPIEIDADEIIEKMDNNRADIQEQLDAKGVVSYWRRFIVDRFTSPKGPIVIKSELKSEVRRAATRVSSIDSPHFFGCEPIQKVQMTERGIEIKAKKSLLKKLNKIIIEEKLVDSNGQISIIKIPAGEYQIRRLYEACKNINLRPEDSNIPIYVNGVKYDPNTGYKSNIAV